jgi:hypothetical protein
VLLQTLNSMALAATINRSFQSGVKARNKRSFKTMHLR